MKGLNQRVFWKLHIWGLLFSSDISPGIVSDILSGISFDILSDISPDILSDNLSGISSDILSDISPDILPHILSGISFDILSEISPHILSGISIDILSDILPGIGSDILSDISSTLLTFFRASFLTFFLTSLLTFFLASLLTFFLPFETRQGTLAGRRWGLAGNTGRSWVAGNTGRGGSCLRSGKEHWQWGRWSDIKSNNPQQVGNNPKPLEYTGAAVFFETQSKKTVSLLGWTLGTTLDKIVSSPKIEDLRPRTVGNLSSLSAGRNRRNTCGCKKTSATFVAKVWLLEGKTRKGLPLHYSHKSFEIHRMEGTGRVQKENKGDYS